jgi:3-dehydroquinate synthetase
LFSLLEERATELRAGDSDAIAMVVRASVAAKIRVVRDDERELGARALLNLGHTVGHALEAHFGYSQLLHGEAVAVGTTIEALAAEHLGLTPVGIAARLRGLFLSLGLPTACARSDVETAWPYVLSDKKRASTSLRLPVVRNIGFGRVVSVPLEDLRSAVIHAAARAER